MPLHNPFIYFVIGLLALCVLIHVSFGVYNFLKFKHWKGKTKRWGIISFITLIIASVLILAPLTFLILAFIVKLIGMFGEFIFMYLE